MSGGPGRLWKTFRNQYFSFLSTHPLPGDTNEPGTCFGCDLLRLEGLGRLPEPRWPRCVIKQGSPTGGLC